MLSEMSGHGDKNYSRMKRLRILPGFILLAIGALVAGLWVFGEPTQGGKPVSYWISQLGMRGPDGSMVGESVLDKMDPAKISPYLVRAIGAKEQPESKWHRFYRQHYSQLPGFFRRRRSEPQGPDDMHRTTQYIRRQAAYYLTGLAKKKAVSAKEIVPRLVPLLDDAEWIVRFSAGQALTGFGKEAGPAVPKIMELLKNHPDKIHDIMLVVLEKCGPEARAAIPVLQECVKSAGPNLRICCARTLWTLDHAQADLVGPIARELSSEKDAGARIEAASLLWRMDKDPAPVVPVLIGLLKDDPHPFNFRVILLLKQTGPGAADAVPALSDWLDRNQISSARTPDFVIKAANEALAAMSATNVVR